MKKILLLGDSIRMGYQSYVKELLSDEYEVVFPEDNGRFATYTLWQANQMFRKYSDIALVHFNNGYWDMNIEPPMTEAMLPIDDYKNTIRRIAQLSINYGAKVVFATTVPVIDGGSSEDNTGTGASLTYKNSWIDEYNEAAKSVMDELNVPINDLHALCLEHEKCYKCGDLLHLTEEGNKKCAQQTVELIRKILG